uniref:Uncharacterized protein n=1 Tax=Picea sitchensis TaxID=3332 RepID=A9NRE9_PICSI|nr:unknown [Picea sitchensis]
MALCSIHQSRSTFLLSLSSKCLNTVELECLWRLWG